MRRSIRTILGLAAATTVLAVGAPALATSASAATTKAGASVLDDFEDSWGYDYSKYFHGSRAKARGDVWIDRADRLHVSGRLYDKDSPRWLCGYVQVKFENTDGDESVDSAIKCGSNGYRTFHFWERDVDNAQVRVCYWDDSRDKKVYCGRWDYVYEADQDDE
ncbi:hypothetical protein Ssi03_28430 [Sphaerisporangium siamense]|uniref:Secreted protein n=1 Tax=Sphaerisporangium siamense TaxID=795645 RepID=A0A7W7D3W2_9ACTN|nr:hypothetical protein [Sphaerisporangium siamense]MBB4699827.1 hypothetical protein [Sphaerisporangium siamense]GII84853.1 hypothetical protein Ssi03_28430 [Sphaerisporangium siamense]